MGNDGQHAGNAGNAGNAEPGRHSTAALAAAARAAHLLVDGEPVIFADPLASVLLGDSAQELIGYHRQHGAHPVLAGARTQVSCRGRFTEDCLGRAVGRGLTQYVILGAGLDTFAYRSGLAGRLRVFEVDQPATQRWKRRALAAAGIAEPANVTFIPADLTADDLAGRLRAGGCDLTAPVLVSWLGVTLYLTRDAVSETLAAVGTLAPGSELIADYMLPAGLRDEAGAQYAALVAAASAERGEPWRADFAPDELTELARGHGFAAVRQVRQRDTVPAACWDRSDALRPTDLAVVFHGVVCGITARSAGVGSVITGGGLAGQPTGPGRFPAGPGRHA